ncbi:MAG: energy transducer TonB [Candidatus Acidiferrales bacterium]
MPIAHRIILPLVACLACAQGALGQTLPPYSESANNLKRVVEELQEAAKRNDSERFRLVAEPLFFAEHEAWFKEVFGKRFGMHASGTYARRTKEFVDSMRAAFEGLETQGLSEPQVEKLDEPCEPLALTVEYPALFARKRKVPLYSVRFEDDGKFRTLGFFTYKGGGFRYVGHVDLGPVFQPKEALQDTPGIIKVGGGAQNPKLLHRPPPTYPWRARRRRLQGTVRMQAIVGVDGTIQDLQLVSGHCWLAEAAMDAVRRWRYQPTLLNGAPVEISTIIDVIFTLSN